MNRRADAGVLVIRLWRSTFAMQRTVRQRWAVSVTGLTIP